MHCFHIFRGEFRRRLLFSASVTAMFGSLLLFFKLRSPKTLLNELIALAEVFFSLKRSPSDRIVYVAFCGKQKEAVSYFLLSFQNTQL